MFLRSVLGSLCGLLLGFVRLFLGQSVGDAQLFLFLMLLLLLLLMVIKANTNKLGLGTMIVIAIKYSRNILPFFPQKEKRHSKLDSQRENGN